MWVYLVLGVVLGGGVGLLAGFLWASRRGKAVQHKLETERGALDQKVRDLERECERLRIELKNASEKNAWLDQATEILTNTFKALASDALRNNAEELISRAKEAISSLLTDVKGDWGKSKEEIKGLLNPLKDALEKLEGHVRDLESKREGAYSALKVQLEQVAKTHEELSHTTANLVQALKSPIARGRWGEMQLQRIVEMAGLQKHIDFEKQVGTDSGRPDLIVHLPNGGMLAVDAKVPMDAFWKALEANEESERRKYAQEHAKTLLGHVRELGKKRYWESLGKTPDLVIMFVPSESCVATAFEVEPGLFEESWRNNVILATPTLLFALLKTVAWGWQQHEIAEEAQIIAEEALKLFRQFAVFSKHFKELGDRLKQAVDAYNDAAASAREKLLPLAQRYSERVGKEFPEPPSPPSPVPFDVRDIIGANNPQNVQINDEQ